MVSTRRVLSLALAAISLWGCNPEGQGGTSVQVADPGGTPTGSASVRLPAMPQDYLAKSAAGTQAIFVLTISGSGMSPMRSTWPLPQGQGGDVKVSGIPVGANRIFDGRLYRLGAAKGDTVLTHEGVDSTAISHDSVAEVILHLHAAGQGAAHVCVEVDGWPVDPACPQVEPPKPPTWSSVQGCWQVVITKIGGSSGHAIILDTAKMSITAQDSNLMAVVNWRNGDTETAVGEVLYGNVLGFGWPYPQGDFHFKATLDTLGSEMRGDITDARQGLNGLFTAIRIPCDTSGDLPVPKHAIR